MKNTALFFAILLLAISVTVARAGSAEDFLSLNQEYENSYVLDLTEAVPQEILLQTREVELTNRLLQDEKERGKLETGLDSLGTPMLDRLISRVSFEVEQEGQGGLKSFLESLRAAKRVSWRVIRLKKKIANIYGREVNLLDGEWKHAPDGRRYWVSNEYPEVVLSAAEYRRYLATASVVQEP